VFLAVDLFARIEADGLDAFIQNIGVANLELVAAALERIDVSQAAEIVRTAGAAASPLGGGSARLELSTHEESLLRLKETAFRKIVAFAQAHRADLD